ncbi:MAG TPA: hypothetical protein VEK73_16885, partial [Xanthobacteraceae bacterium]|nr:hypothetical protein [Xanthobacteraceae bacterium]
PRRDCAARGLMVYAGGAVLAGTACALAGKTLRNQCVPIAAARHGWRRLASGARAWLHCIEGNLL